MARKMLIDAAHPEETRVALLDEKGLLVDYEFKSSTKETVKGNIYLAKIMRVEPSLQAAFVDYGGGRHGFLAFGEIHPDYFRIPIADREALKAELSRNPDVVEDDTVATEQTPGQPLETAQAAPQDEADMVASIGGELPPSDEEEDVSKRASLHRRYKIQEVVQKNQIILVQVVKEERGNKGAALTTYLSLAGRYCVLMPNSPRSGGISRKISNPADRKRLRQILEAFNIPEGMGLIIRTAGKERTRAELKRDGQYLMRLWDSIREKTLSSSAPSLVHSEEDIVKRAVRDLYSKDVEVVLVAGEEGYKAAKDFMKALVPSHSKRVQRYKSDRALLFHEYGVERQIDNMYEPEVRLPSGGSIVIHPTEALVSIDINSGKATRERHIEETASKTNLEAATEIARQVRLRDLAGLIVIDFIDMDEPRNVAAVERRMREAFRDDRARIQVGRISPFGLLEMSRQRLAPSLLETSANPCPHCRATGYVRSTESLALSGLRLLEQEGLKNPGALLQLNLPQQVLIYIMNQKRAPLADIEARHGVRVNFETTHDMSYICTVSVLSTPDTPVIEATPTPRLEQPPRENTQPKDTPTQGNQERGQRRRRDGRDGRKNEHPQEDAVQEEKTPASEKTSAPENKPEAEKVSKPTRKSPARDNTGTSTDAAPETENKKPKEGAPTNEDGSPLETPSASRRRRLRRRAGRRGGRDKVTPEGGVIGNPSMGNEAPLVLDNNAPQGTAFPSTTIAATFDPNSPLYSEDGNNPFDPQKEKTWWKRLLE